ncbi:von Willebrand factor [Planctomycetes bacterium Poly30]|uniref:von Willebrand factor n=1 Tax=Saltatorellus ferox TaxID=2528018 RepID=A0A518F046_9BACT|nr:von Willebrand factor [Planctomycetes bacterium Poly30]
MKHDGEAAGRSQDPRVLAYLLGELGPEERAAIEEALANGDEELSAELRALEAFLPTLQGTLGLESEAESGAESGGGERELSEAARGSILEAASAARGRTKSHWPALLAAVVLSLACIGAWMLVDRRPAYDGGTAYDIGGSSGGAPERRWFLGPRYSDEMIIKNRDQVRSPSSALESMGYLGSAEDLGSSEDLDPSFAAIAEGDFILTANDARSTFAIDVDTASYALTRSRIRSGRFPRPDEIRVEEFINYFSYGDEPPAPGTEHPLALTTQVAAAPWNPEHRLVRIGVAARRIEFQERRPANLVFLVDVSGSMASADKLPLVVRALGILTESLAPDDRIAIVVYASREGLALESTPVAAREAILQALDSLRSGGSTDGGKGIQLAYRIARSNFVEDGINRVILCTDGDFNVGVRSVPALAELIAEEASSGIDLTVLGFGSGSFRDDLMEGLSNRGNGNFAYIDSELEARKVLATEVGGTLVTVARDTKIQVEWDPALVHSFRQIGYENRQLAHADFEDDRVDAGEVGAGHVVTALYEIVPVPGASLSSAEAIGEVRVRYQPPSGGASRLLTAPVRDGGATFDEGPEALRFGASAAAFGMVLRGSEHVGDATLSDVRRWALESLGGDPGGLRNAFVELVERAEALEGR